MANGSNTQTNTNQQANNQVAALTAGTVTPHYPTYIETATRMGDTSVGSTTVPLWTLSFLGVRFRSGINAILADKLIDAQRNLFNLFCALQNITDRLNVQENDFKLWCWYGQEPVGADPANLSKIQAHVGLKDKKNQNSRHFSGSALDINLEFNPFIAGRTGNSVYGETHDTFPDSLVKSLAGLTDTELNSYTQSRQPDAGPLQPDSLKNGIRAAKMKFWTDHIWAPAIAVIDHAMQLFYNEDKADLHDVTLDPQRHKEINVHYNRFSRASQAVRWYIGLPYNYLGDSSKHAVVQPDVVAQTLRTYLSQSQIHPDARDVDGAPLNTSLAANPNAVAKKFIDRIVVEHEILRLVMVNGSCQISADGKVSAPSSRDPCNGFLNLRPEIVAELSGGDFGDKVITVGQKLRWGCCMFGPGPDSSGDVMHFDLWTHFGNGGIATAALNRHPGTLPEP
jgi:hypothetical protein